MCFYMVNCGVYSFACWNFKEPGLISGRYEQVWQLNIVKYVKRKKQKAESGKQKEKSRKQKEKSKKQNRKLQKKTEAHASAF